MAGFDISSPTTTVALRRTRDGYATGEASFTVANQTGHAVRARATPVAEGSTDWSWLDPDKPERNLQAGVSDLFIVFITVPPATTAGEYQFRLDVASVTLPDEEWGRGGSVRFQVPEAVVIDEPEKEEEPGYLETVGGALGGGIAVGGVLLLLGFLLGILVGGDDLGKAILGFIFAVLGALLGAWIGPLAGAFLALRIRGFPDPWRTVLPMVILIPLIGLPLFIASSAIRDAVDATGALQSIWLFFTAVLAVTVPALLARAFARWRQTGHL